MKAGRGCRPRAGAADHGGSRRDTPDILKQYVTAFDPRFLGLTGTPDQVKKAAASFKAYYAKAPTKDGGYSMDHTAAFYLLDGKGESRVLANNNIGWTPWCTTSRRCSRADQARAGRRRAQPSDRRAAARAIHVHFRAAAQVCSAAARSSSSTVGSSRRWDMIISA